jgi:hypothetical protein
MFTSKLANQTVKPEWFWREANQADQKPATPGGVPSSAR